MKLRERLFEIPHNAALPLWVQMKINFVNKNDPGSLKPSVFTILWIEPSGSMGDISDHANHISVPIAKLIERHQPLMLQFNC